jgi:hypothetical protein
MESKGLLRHLDLLIDKMNQKSSVIQCFKSVPMVLTSDISENITINDSLCEIVPQNIK